MIIFPSLDDQPSGRVDNRLKWMQIYSARQTENTVTVVHTTDNERVNECFCGLSRASAANCSQLTQLIKTASSQAPDMRLHDCCIFAVFLEGGFFGDVVGCRARRGMVCC